MTAKVMFSFPNNLAVRMRAAIPARDRSKIVALLLEKEINAREHRLYLCAKELEESPGLQKEMLAWNSSFDLDGLDGI